MRTIPNKAPIEVYELYERILAGPGKGQKPQGQ